ncbi:casein kinase I alpha, partial [Gaertneriomyces semiglobifer]
VIQNRWEVHDKIGEGSFGEVYAAVDLQDGTMVAIKRESSTSLSPQLQHEYSIYTHLVGLDGFPRIYYGGKEGQYNVLVMDRLGPSLKLLQNESPGGCLPLQTVVYIVPQVIRLLALLHNRGIVFRDVKASQFCVGRYGDDITVNPKLFLIDFGLATYYVDENNQHVRNRRIDRHAARTGTARYASLNVHRGKLHSRRDDIESLAYILIELLKGTLPWSNVKAMTSREGWKKTMDLKEDLLTSELCEGLPEEFEQLLNYARNLQYADTPDYAYLEGL